jgi:hypothetical protein
MEVIGYTGHVKVSSLAWGNSKGLEGGRAVPVQSKHATWPQASMAVPIQAKHAAWPGASGPGSGPIGSFQKHSPTEPPGVGPGHGPIGHALITQCGMNGISSNFTFAKMSTIVVS